MISTTLEASILDQNMRLPSVLNGTMIETVRASKLLKRCGQ
jgi:hypothetical protein